MDNKRLTNEWFRLAFSHLKATQKGTLKEIAKACGCSDKHIGNILSKDKRVGSSPEIKHKVAAFYSTSIGAMLSMGKDLSEGRLPAAIDNSSHVTNSHLVNSQVASGNGSITLNRDADLAPTIAFNLTPREYEAVQAIRSIGGRIIEAIILFDLYGNKAGLERCITDLMRAKSLTDR